MEFWDNPDTSVSPDDQKMLTSYFYNFAAKEPTTTFHPGRSAGSRSDHLCGRDYQCGDSHARFAIGFPGHPASSHIELRAILCDRACSLRRFCPGRLQGHGFEQRHSCWRNRSTSASVAWRWPMQRRSSGVTPRPRWTIGRSISPSVQSRSERVRRQQPPSPGEQLIRDSYIPNYLDKRRGATTGIAVIQVRPGSGCVGSRETDVEHKEILLSCFADFRGRSVRRFSLWSCLAGRCFGDRQYAASKDYHGRKVHPGRQWREATRHDAGVGGRHGDSFAQ